MCDDEIRKVYDWKYAKPMKELTKEDLKTMNKQDLKELLGLPGIAFSTHAAFPRQAVGFYKVPGFSTMTHPELAEMVLKTRDEKIAKREQFYAFCRGKWIKDPNPIVRWGKSSVADLHQRHTVALQQVAHLPPNVAKAIVPRSKHMHDVGNVLQNRYKTGRFYKVVGHTKGGNPQLKELRHKVVSELNTRISNYDRKHTVPYLSGGIYLNSQFLEPNTNHAPLPDSVRWNDEFYKWNGKPKHTTVGFLKSIRDNHSKHPVAPVQPPKKKQKQK